VVSEAKGEATSFTLQLAGLPPAFGWRRRLLRQIYIIYIKNNVLCLSFTKLEK
jgi:hypothetical protein